MRGGASDVTSSALHRQRNAQHVEPDGDDGEGRLGDGKAVRVLEMFDSLGFARAIRLV